MSDADTSSRRVDLIASAPLLGVLVFVITLALAFLVPYRSCFKPVCRLIGPFCPNRLCTPSGIYQAAVMAIGSVVAIALVLLPTVMKRRGTQQANAAPR